MKLPRRKFLRLAAGAAALPAVTRIAWAQSYPARPVRVIVPYAPGGPTDVFGRLIAQKLSEQFGRQFFVENIGGAGGNIGMGRAARADRDGHTVVIVATPLAINPSLYDTVPFDPIKDFDPVTLAVSTTTVLTVHPSVPAQTTRDLVALIRANPGKYSFASPGTGTPSHLLGELFRLSLKLDLVHVPFNSGGLAIGSNLAGHTLLCFGTPPPALPHIKDGKLRPLGVTSKARVPTLPDVPTMAEAGYPDVERSRALDGCWTGPAHLRPTSFSIAASWCGSTPSAFITAWMIESDRMSSSVGSYCRHFRFIHFLAGCKTTMA